MNKGVVLFAFNNGRIDYIKQAIHCAKRVKNYLKLPVQLITNDKEYIESNFPFWGSLESDVFSSGHVQMDVPSICPIP